MSSAITKHSRATDVYISANQNCLKLDLPEILRYRDLLYFLTWRDIKVRYKQTALGICWALIQPLATSLIFTFVFNRMAKIPSNDCPYQLFVFVGLLPWTLFSTAITQASLSLVNQNHLITKVYFPRIFVPISSCATAFVDASISLLCCGLFLAYYQYPLTINLVALPLIVGLTAVFTVGVGIAISAVTVRFRDLRFVVPFVLQLWMYVSPVIYPANLIPEKFKFLEVINPMVGIINGFRFCLLGQQLDLSCVISSTIMSLVVLVVGTAIFQATERRIADVV